MHNEQTRDRFIELRAQHWSFDRIARELNVSKPTLIVWSRQFQSEEAQLSTSAYWCAFESIRGFNWSLGKSCRLNFGKVPVKKWYGFGKVLSLNFTAPKIRTNPPNPLPQRSFPKIKAP